MRYILGPADAGRRVDAWVAATAGVSRRRAVDLLAAGAFQLNGDPVAPDHRIHTGDVISGEATPDPTTTLAPEQGVPVPIIFSDAHLLVVNKPAGLTVHPGSGRPGGTLVNALLGMGIPLAAAGGPVRPGVVHRLDKDTSGLLLVAKTDKAFWALAKMAQDHEFQREYLAVVAGIPDPPRGTIDAALGRDARRRAKFTVVQSGGRDAITHYEVIETFKGAALVKLVLETGRTHQIRVHLAACGWPLLGDRSYGSPERRGVRPAMGLPDPGRQALHAAKLGFVHPITGKPRSFSAPLPADLAGLVKDLRLR